MSIRGAPRALKQRARAQVPLVPAAAAHTARRGARLRAGVVRGLDDADAQARVVELPRARQAGHSRAHHHHVQLLIRARHCNALRRSRGTAGEAQEAVDFEALKFLAWFFGGHPQKMF